jgi:hypothetical protein
MSLQGATGPTEMMVFNYHEDRADILISFVLLLFVREPREEEAPVSPRTRLEGEPG